MYFFYYVAPTRFGIFTFSGRLFISSIMTH